MSDEDWNSINKYSEKNKIQLYLDIFGNKGLNLCQKIGVKTVNLSHNITYLFLKVFLNQNKK